MVKRELTLRLALTIVTCLMTGFGLGSAYAQDQSTKLEPRAFQKNYLTFELARNYPVSFSENRFDPGPSHPVLGFLHRTETDWLMGLAAQFKIFDRKIREEDDPEEIALWTFAHQALYTVRLYHPTYLFIGPKLLYMLPTNAARLPLQRDEEYQLEIGAALSVALAHVVSDDWILTLRMDRWRGMGTMRFHGLEIAVGLGA